MYFLFTRLAINKTKKYIMNNQVIAFSEQAQTQNRTTYLYMFSLSPDRASFFWSKI